MKQLTNLLFICLLLYVSSLSMKHNNALNSKSFLQTKMNYGCLKDRATNFRMYGQFLEADCKTSTGKTKLCRLNINRRIGFHKNKLVAGKQDFLKKCKVIDFTSNGSGVFINTMCDKNKYRSFNLSELLGVDNDGHMTILEFLQSLCKCFLSDSWGRAHFNYICYCKDKKGKLQTSEINLYKKIRNKNGRLEYFFKNFDNSCWNVSLLSNIILTAECLDNKNDIIRSELDLSNYFYMKNGKIKSY